MKRLNKILSVMLAVLMLLSFVSCSSDNEALGGKSDDGSAVVMKYGNVTLSEKEYMYILTNMKTMWVAEFQSYYYELTGSVYSEDQILGMPISKDSDDTLADFIKDYAVEYAQRMLIIESLCSEAGLQITNEEDLADISGYLADVEYAYGGVDLFEIKLAKLGFSRSGIERSEKFYKYYELYSDYRYGENGVARVPAETVNKYFLENYLAYDGCSYSFVDNEGEKILYDFTDDEIKAYFNENYVKVRHVLYMTVDKYNKKLSDEKIAEQKAKAEAAYAAIVAGEKTIYDFETDNEDSSSEYTFTKGKMVKEFENASFEMSVGDTRLVETEYGYHIVHKLSLSDADLFGTASKEEASEDDTTDTSSDGEADAANDTKDKETTEVKKGIKDDVVFEMSKEKIRQEARATLEKLQSGELETYPEEDTAKKYYTVMKAGLVDKNDSKNKTFVEILSKFKLDEFSESEEISSDAIFLIRNRSFTEKDITSSIYSNIENSLISEEYKKFIESYFDKVEIDYDALNKFDVNTIAVLEEEFYMTY